MTAKSDLWGYLSQRFEVTPSGCWLWTGWRDRYGYGSFKIVPKSFTAHRATYQCLRGPVPEGLVLDHLCRNRACCNPDHMEVVTQRVNNLRGVAPQAINARKAACDRGHPFSPENTYVREDGHRQCRTCQRERQRRSPRLRRKADAA